MASKKYESVVDGPVVVAVHGADDVAFDGNTYETDNVNQQAALDANPDVREVKVSKKK